MRINVEMRGRGPLGDYQAVQGVPNLDTEAQTMRSSAVAEIAARDPTAGLTALITQKNAYRPFETMQRNSTPSSARTSDGVV